jgi:uncharacterized RDD family membrane protein YckC
MKTSKPDEEYEYAGFWIRVGATLIDQVILLMITAYPLTQIYGKGYFLPREDAPFTLVHGWADFLLSWVFPAVMILGFWVWRCATPGKIAIRSIIVDAQTGERPSPGQFLLRYAGYFLSLLPFGLGFLWIVWDKRKQGWHDKIAGTVVVREKHRGPLPVRFYEGGQPNPPPLPHARGGHAEGEG